MYAKVITRRDLKPIAIEELETALELKPAWLSVNPSNLARVQQLLDGRIEVRKQNGCSRAAVEVWFEEEDDKEDSKVIALVDSVFKPRPRTSQVLAKDVEYMLRQGQTTRQIRAHFKDKGLEIEGHQIARVRKGKARRGYINVKKAT